MFAEKVIIETDAQGCLKKMPVLPPNKRFETIFLVIGDSNKVESVKRHPCRDLKGAVKIHGDILNSASEGLWNLPK